MTSSSQKTKSLSEIFQNNRQFIIPDYQRGYSWGEEQLDDLWEDLENITGSRTHYTGMFTFCTNNQNDRMMQIVDGQQRMTTLIILIAELLKRIEEGIQGGESVEEYTARYLYKKPFGSVAYKYNFQYSADDPSDTFFKTEILGHKDFRASLQPKDTLYTKNLRFAKQYFSSKISGWSQGQLADLFLKVTEKLKFNEYVIDELDEVYVTFETMNNRGKSLTTLELLKNRLIYLSTLFGNMANGDDTQIRNVEYLRSAINEVWKSIYSELGRSTKRLLNDDTFLRDHWIMYFRYDRSASMIFKKDLLSDYFTARKVWNNDLSIEDILNYVRSLQDSIRIWFSINCPSESTLSSESKEWLTRLNRIGIGSFRPLLMAAYHHMSEEDALTLVKACERFRFLVSAFSARRSNTSDSRFYSLAHDYFIAPDKHRPIEVVESETTRWTSVKNFIDEAIERYNDQEGFYSWNGLRYFLYEYEKELQKQGEVKVEWDTFEHNQSGKISIEHIYPQTPTDEYWNSRFTTEAHKELRHSIGNLLLLSRAKNSELQNDAFDVKKKTIKDANGNIIHNGYDNGSHSELDVARNNEWTPEAIISRGRELLDFLLRHWNIEHTFTQEEINLLLNIEAEQE